MVTLVHLVSVKSRSCHCNATIATAALMEFENCVNVSQRITDLGVEGLMPLTRLTALYLGCCNRLTDSAARYIGRSLKVRLAPEVGYDEHL